jgi:hypothetical protein
MDENEILAHSAILFPRRKFGDQDEYGGNVYLSPRGGYGQYLGRNTTLPDYHGHISLDDKEEMIDQILHSLRIAGLVEIVVSEKDDIGHKPGYQLLASGMYWKEGEVSKPFMTLSGFPVFPKAVEKPIPFYVDFYRLLTNDVLGIEAREHTAQVPSKEREERERKVPRWEAADPVLFANHGTGCGHFRINAV